MTTKAKKIAKQAIKVFGRLMSQKEYITTGFTSCPRCRSHDVAGRAPEADERSAWADVECEDCGFEWRDVYTLAFYEVNNAKV